MINNNVIAEFKQLVFSRGTLLFYDDEAKANTLSLSQLRFFSPAHLD